MIDAKTLIVLATASCCFSLQSFASETTKANLDDQVEVQTLELESVDISVIQLSKVQDQASKNANEIHQETTLGRAGLAGTCM